MAKLIFKNTRGSGSGSAPTAAYQNTRETRTTPATTAAQSGYTTQGVPATQSQGAPKQNAQSLTSAAPLYTGPVQTEPSGEPVPRHMV